jgi:uncharacterized integral membrane protein
MDAWSCPSTSVTPLPGVAIPVGAQMVTVSAPPPRAEPRKCDVSTAPEVTSETSWQCGVACLTRFAGRAFASFTIAVNLADVVTDIIVAVEFHQQREKMWFALVITFLLLANVAMAVYTCEVHMKYWPRIGRWPRLLRFLSCFVLGPFLPLISFIVSERQGNSVHSNDNGSADLPIYMREEIADTVRSRAISEALLRGRREHFQNYDVFYIETATESIPQAVIQLLAITFLGRASYAQLISLCCCLFSIMSKAVIFAASYDMKVFVFSFLIVAHDVFSTFYLFSTVVGQETQKDTDFLGLAVSYLGYAWLVKVFVFAACYLIGGVLYTARTFRLGMYLWGPANCRLYAPFGKMLMGAVFIGPVIVAAEFVRVSSYTFVRFIAERRVNRRSREGIVLLWNFLSRDDEIGTRLRHVVECFMACEICLTHFQHTRMWDTSLRAPSMVYEDVAGYLDARFHSHETHPEKCHDSDYEVLMTVPAQYFAPMWEHLKSIGPDGKLTMWDVERWTRCSQRSLSYSGTKRRYFFLSRVKEELFHPPEHTAMVALAYFAVCIFTLGQILAFVYPFINASVNFHSHNLLQAVCFYGLCFTLLLALPLVPATCRHQVFRWALCSLPTSNFTTETVSEWIRHYYTPSPSVALQVAVDALVVPSEVMAAVVAPFVGPAMAMSTMTRVECMTVRAAARARSYLGNSVTLQMPVHSTAKQGPATDTTEAGSAVSQGTDIDRVQ